MWLLFAFIAIPLIEIALFIEIGGWLGLWPTLGIVVLTAVIGSWLVRDQGLRALGNLQESFNRLEDPTEQLAHAAMILIAGVLLLTPGFFTDAVGFSFLVPRFRLAVFHYVRSRVKVHSFAMGQQTQFHDAPRNAPPARDDVIDGDFTEVDPSKRPTHPPSGWTKH